MAETEQTQTQTQEAPAHEAVPNQPVSEATRENPVDVSGAEYAQVDPDAMPAGEEHLDKLLDIELPITVTLGKTEIPLRRLMQLQPGSVLSLDKRLGEPAELLVRDVPFALGDIVIVEDCYAVRIREILTSAAAVGLDKEPEKATA